jgi:hypothetical protein
MNNTRLVYLGVISASLFWACGRESATNDGPSYSAAFATTEKVIYANATINQQPVRFVLDTGSSGTILSKESAKRLDLKIQAPVIPETKDEATDPVHIRMGVVSCTASLPVMDGPTDGLLGWPEVQNDILVFDANRHIVRSQEELPPETTTWLKLPVHRGIILTLTIPNLDKKTNLIMVDTGSGFGVGLRPPQWRIWRAAHADLPMTKVTYAFSGTAPVTAEVVWADDFQLGPLRLTDVPVYEELSPAISGWDEMAASFGLLALDRLDLVVDGKNDVAYLKPKPPIPPLYKNAILGAQNSPTQNASALRPWTAADDLQVGLTGILKTLVKKASDPKSQ